MRIKCPFCSYNLKHIVSDHVAVLKSADMLRYHLQYECPIHNVDYVRDYL